MQLIRFKQGYNGIRRQYGVSGIIKLNHKSIGGAVNIYTLESPWNDSKDEPNGKLGLSCVNSGNYTISIEISPVDNKEYPFIFNENLNVCLRSKINAIDRTGHAMYSYDGFNPLEIYGRFILVGTGQNYNPSGFVQPISGDQALAILKTYIKESGDTSLTIRWE